MKVDEIKAYIEGMQDEASKGIVDAIKMLNNKNISTSDYNHYAVALTKAQAQYAACQRILEKIKRG